MKITKSYLKTLIKEELNAIVEEEEQYGPQQLETPDEFAKKLRDAHQEMMLRFKEANVNTQDSSRYHISAVAEMQKQIKDYTEFYNQHLKNQNKPQGTSK